MSLSSRRSSTRSSSTRTSSSSQEILDNSFDENGETLDMASVIAEFPNGDDLPGQMIPIKKLSEVFESCATQQQTTSATSGISSNNASSMDREEGIGSTGMKVFLRVRPIGSSSSSSSASNSTIRVIDETSIVTSAPETSKRAQYTKLEERHYTFTRVFDPSSAQAEVFTHTVEPILERFMQGESCVIFAYGMTNAGKTHTIQGTTQNPGIMPRLVSAILERIDAGGEDGDWELSTSMLEIYQEKIYDLLSKKRDKLSIRDGNGRVEVCKLSSHVVTSSLEAFKLMDEGSSRRAKSQTNLNAGSSRSHAVYTLSLAKKGSSKEPVVFQVVDLAGAERGNRTKANQAQQKEANNINVSLMQLWRCLHGMKRHSGGIDIVPFRESKLTHILMPLLSRAGLAGVAMIACVNPQSDDYDETVSILGNASLACKIKEITDLGRVGGVGGGAAAATSGAQAKEGGRTSAGNEDPKAGGKKRRADGSTIGPNKVAGAGTRDSMVTNGTTVGALKRTASGKAFVSINLDSSEVDNGAPGGSNDENNAETVQELKRLRKDVARLELENKKMHSAQLKRETEIRMQVSEEMAARSAHLLEQIQELQDQLYARQSHVDDVTKSCKKAKKRMVELANEEAANDLLEAEEELERVKAAYESEIAKLKEDKARLEAEVEMWRNKAMGLETAPSSSINSVFNPMVQAATSNAVVNKTAVAESFSQRMQRDQRFNKGSEQQKQEPPAKLTKSPSRSPLAPVQHNGTSPVNNDTKDPSQKQRPASPKRAVSPGPQNRAGDSPIRKRQAASTADENSRGVAQKLQAHQQQQNAASSESNNVGQTYLKRLRSHFIRA